MSNAVRLLPSVNDDGTLKRKKNTAFGTAGASFTAKQGRLYRVTVHNKSATPYYFQIHDKATAPLAAEVPIWEERLPASTSITFQFDAGLYCALGIGFGLSTTPEALTLAAATDAVVYAQYTVQT